MSSLGGEFSIAVIEEFTIAAHSFMFFMAFFEG
jgi:hypothetical protein